MGIRDFYMKSEIQRARDNVVNDILKQQGMYDMFYLGQIATIESLINYIDKEICLAYLKGLVEGEDINKTIKDLSQKLIDKYIKEPKFEL